MFLTMENLGYGQDRFAYCHFQISFADTFSMNIM